MCIRDRTNAVRGPLHGIPILLKDNIGATPMANSAGSLALKDFRPQTDAFLVKRLREAGAVILGKTNLSEWANFRSSRSTSGWSARGGQTRNPYALDRNPCGSSSGSAVAVSANLAAAAIGTETDGSILCPAAVNGLVGLKPVSYTHLDVYKRQVYASALHGYASLDDTTREGDMTPLYEAIMQHAPKPEVDPEGAFQMRISQLDYNNFVGVIGIGRIQRGTLKKKMCIRDRSWIFTPLCDFPKAQLISGNT